MKVNQIGLCLLGTLALNAAWPSPAVADDVVPVANASTFSPTVFNKTQPPTKAPEGMVWIPGLRPLRHGRQRLAMVQ